MIAWLRRSYSISGHVLHPSHYESFHSSDPSGHPERFPPFHLVRDSARQDATQ